MVNNMDHGLPKFSLLGYDDWKIMMEAHLYALHDCMWMVLEDGPLKIQMENPERNPANPDVVQYIPKPKEKWDDRDCKKHNLDNVAKAAIFKTLDPITFSKIKHLKTAMEIWQGLGKWCEGSEDLRKQKIEVLLEKFKSFKMLPGESFDMLDERFHKILNDLASLNHILSHKEKNVRLLRSLPTEWYTKATTMEEGRNLENYTVHGLLDELRTYEHELKKKKEEQVTPFPTALMTTPRIPSSEGTCTRNCDTPSSSQPSSSKMENYDEEFAMMVKQFRKFKKFFKKADSVRRPSKGKLQVEKYGERERNEKKKKAMVAAESDESSSSSSDEEALGCMERRVEKSNHEDRWTMSEDDTLCLMAKDDADQEVTSQTSCSSCYESIPTSESLCDKFKKMMKDFEEINLKHSSLIEENKLLSVENIKLTEGRKSQLDEITQLKTENKSLSEKMKSLNKELGILKSKVAVDKLLEATKQKGREGLGFDPSSSKRKGRTTFIPNPISRKERKRRNPQKFPKRHMTGDASLLSNLIPYDGPRVTFGGSNDFGLTKGLGNLVYKGLTIQAVSYVEGLNYNLLSISQFCDKGYSLEFYKDMASLKNISTNEVILTGKRIRNIYEVMWDDVKEAYLISKGDTNLLWLWHKRLSHLNFKTLNKLSKEGLVEDKDEEASEGDRMKPTEFIPFGSLPLKTSQRNPDSDGAEPSGNHGQPSIILDHSNGDNSGNGDPVPIHPESPTNFVLQPEAELDQPVNPNQHNLRWLRDHPPQQVIGDIQSGVRTRSAQQNLEAMLACFISQVEPKNIEEALADSDLLTQISEKMKIVGANVHFQKLEAKSSSPTFYQFYLEMIDAQELSEFLYMEIRLKYENKVLEFYKNGKVKSVKSKKDPQRTIQIINSTVGGAKVKLSQKKLGEKLHLPNSGVEIGRLPAKNLDWNMIGISGQAPSGPAKKADLNNDYKLVLELVIACLECGSGGHADDITQERAFIINALITKSKLNWAAHFFNSISKHLGKPNQKYLCQGLYIGHILESMGVASDDEDPAVYRPIFSKATKDQVAPTTKAQADMEATVEDFQIFLETSPSIETILTEVDQENAASTPQEQNQEASEEELQQLLHSQALEILTTPCEITNPTETEISEKSAKNLEMSKPPEANEVQEEQAVEIQRSSAEAEKEIQMAGLETSETPVAVFKQQNEVTNFHFHNSSTSTLPDEIPENWTRKVQGLIESALASQHASFRQEIEQMEARHNKLMEKSEEKRCSNLKEISKSVDKTLEIISLLSNSMSNTMEAYASDSHLQFKEITRIKEQIATVTLPIEVKQGELTYIPSHLNMTELILEAQQSNPENSTQHLTDSGLDGSEVVGTIASHFSDDAQTKERYNNLRRIKEQCGIMQGIGETAGSSKRRKQ
ncbi:unnamed protein product [Cuscuta campestris]|uniref:GAG-pre-integrase domain-containing protein n=1 Tax=Cuscuta campestris TaxID=132261 RepID=A0A484M2I8_9ASTE|nr:unnamed protein product [Cuscuta campestris]